MLLIDFFIIKMGFCIFIFDFVKYFFVFVLDYSLKFFALWQFILFCFLIIFRKTICDFIKGPLAHLVDRIKWFKFKDFEAILSSADLTKEVKENFLREIINLYRIQINQISLGFKGFIFQKTKKQENITGDGSSHMVVFEKKQKGNENEHQGAYYADQNCKILLSWHIPFSGIRKQQIASIQIDSSNERINYEYPNIQSLKDLKGNLVLSGESFVEMEAGDTLKLEVQIGSDQDKKTVSLSGSNAAFFKGTFV